MSRVIKFRAFDTETKKMFIPLMLMLPHTDNSDIVMQFTGLLDKNGREIYEGDVVKIYEEDEDSPSGRIHERIGFIYWHEKECRYKYGTKKHKILGGKDWHDYAEFPSYLCEHEVIGNIHENPELLKAGEK